MTVPRRTRLPSQYLCVYPTHEETISQSKGTYILVWLQIEHFGVPYVGQAAGVLSAFNFHYNLSFNYCDFNYSNSNSNYDDFIFNYFIFNYFIFNYYKFNYYKFNYYKFNYYKFNYYKFNCSSSSFLILLQISNLA
ncbi:hypothetical protein V8C35DRAFT_282520 [Trichoderma chlorosporum]